MASNVEVIQEIGKISTAIARIEERMIRQDSLTEELAKAIKGNGKPGLLDRVSVIENAHAVEKESKEKRSDFSSKVKLLLIGMVITNVGTLLFAILKP